MKSHFWRKNVIMLSLCTQRCYGRHNVSPKTLNHYSCIAICLAKSLFEATNFHFQIMKLTCCLNMAFNLTKSILPLICLHDVTWKRAAALTDHFANAFVRKNVARVYDVVAMLRRSKV